MIKTIEIKFYYNKSDIYLTDTRKMADQKQKSQKEDDDIELFEEMEESFNRIVRELVNDRSLDKFREEYEKLHDALVQSHEHNNILIEKCRQLNQDILANANKISTVLTMSQNDQKTISNLRAEFEKAWKLVEQSQVRESKSKDVIISLKGELQNLTALVNKSTELASSQEKTMQSARAAIVELKAEISKNQEVSNTVSKQLEGIRKELSDIEPQNKALHEEFDTMSKQRAQYKIDRKANRQQMNDAYRGIDETRDTIEKSKVKISDLENEKIDHETNIKKLNNTVKKLGKDIDLIKNSTEDIANRLHDKLVESVKWKNKNANFKFKVDEKRKESDAQDALNNKCIRELNQISKELDNSKVELEEAKQYKEKISKQHAEIVQKMRKCQNDIVSLETQINKTELELRKDHDSVELRNKEKRELVNSYQIEVGKTKSTVQEVEMVNRDCSSARIYQQNQREIADTIDTERQNYAAQLSLNQNNLTQINADIAETQAEINNLTKQLGETQEEIKHQGYLCEAMKSERDLLSRSLQQWITSNEKYESENLSLSNFVSQLKSDVKQQDQKVIDLHLNTKLLQKQLKQMQKDNEDLSAEITKLNKQNLKLEEEKAKQSMVESQALSDIKDQQLKLKSLGSMHNYFGSTMAKRQEECDLLNEKCRLIKDEMRIAEKHYLDKMEEIENLKDGLGQAMQRQKELLILIKKRDLVNEEALRLERDLNRAKSQGRALEDEAENPRNIHRWTLLEAVNPEQFSMIMLKEDLLQSIWTRLNQFSRLRNKAEEFKEKNEKVNKKLTITYAGSYEEDMRSAKEALKRKSLQLSNLTKKVDEKKPLMMNEREKCHSVRTQIREKKAEEFELKRKEAELLNSSMDNVFEVRPPTVSSSERSRPSTARFIGGGFGVGAAQMTTVIPKLDFGRSKSDRTSYGNRVPMLFPASARKIKRPDNKTMLTQNRNRTIMSARVPVDDI